MKQLKEIIEDIYIMKEKYDNKCYENMLRIETMEQFLYTYLNQKYGLKTLIIEWASQIIQAVKTYLRDDHKVTLFAKILKNECDEDFRYHQNHSAENLVSNLKQVLREKFYQKSEKEIQRMAATIVNGYIDEWVWRRLVHKIFKYEDAQFLCSQLIG